MKRRHSFILAVLITMLIASNVFLFSAYTRDMKVIFVSRVIDGDTFEIESGERIRIANINCPEKNEKGYEIAMEFLKAFENKTINAEFLGKDKYNRELARIYSEKNYLNLEIVKSGLAKKFLVENSENREFAKAEKYAIESEKGIWKKSGYFGCFSSEIHEKEEFVVLKNSCGDINMSSWMLTDESRKRFKFSDINPDEIKVHSFKGEDNTTDLFWNLGNIWNNDKDTLYLFDSEGNIVHYHSYGY